MRILVIDAEQDCLNLSAEAGFSTLQVRKWEGILSVFLRSLFFRPQSVVFEAATYKNCNNPKQKAEQLRWLFGLIGITCVFVNPHSEVTCPLQLFETAQQLAAA